MLTGKDEIILYDGMLTTCEEPDPHYFMKVSRLWVSEKGEWGILNGAIFVGKTPLFYFPFYYHPKDLIIQPAFGFRSREGWYLNTTYYIFGEKEADDEQKLVTAKDFIENLSTLKNNSTYITIKPSYIISRVRRSKIDFNRPEKEAFPLDSIISKEIYRFYHEKIK